MKSLLALFLLVILAGCSGESADISFANRTNDNIGVDNDGSAGGTIDVESPDDSGGTDDADNTEGSGGTDDADSTDGSGGTDDADSTEDSGGTDDADSTEDSGGTDDADSTGDSSGTDDADSTEDSGSTDNGVPPADVVTGLVIQRRTGQTFLTWNEVDASSHYHIYRSDQPITTENLSDATLLTNRWGPVDQDSSMHKFGSVDVPAFFVIEDEGTPLGPSTGLFVHTTRNGEAGSAYYAVTSIDNGSENKTVIPGSNTLITAVTETLATPTPVLTISFNEGKGRIYTHFMNYSAWNPTLNGYAFNYMVALPHNFDPARAYPLQVELHEFGGRPKAPSETENQWEVIQVFPSDPGFDENAVHTWWYGHAANHNYLTEGLIPDSGFIENFTEQRILLAVDEVINLPDLNVDTDFIYAFGNSMGAGGVLSLGMRYPTVFSGIYASQPMTNFATSPVFQEFLVQLWGQQSTDLPNVIRGAHSDSLSKYSAGGAQAVTAWNWLNSQQQFRTRSADNFSYLIIDIGKIDTTIDYATQGQPLIQALTDGKIPFSADLAAGVDHRWRAFNAVDVEQFGLSPDNVNPWHYPNTQSFVAIQSASGSGSVPPLGSGDDEYNLNIEWSIAENSFHQPIVDTSTRYEVSLRSTDANQSASITPRNTTAFRPVSGQQCTWTATRNNDDSEIGSGNISVDSNQLVTAVDVPLLTGTGTRLAISCP